MYYLFFDFIVYLIVAASISFLYYYYYRKALIGGFWGGLLVGSIGAVLITLLSTVYDWFTRLVLWLMIPKINGDFYFRVNIITALIGAFLFISLLNHINHDRDRS